jgi:group II intron reverse transcriptase/maturase
MCESELKGKSFVIPKQLVWDAWLKVKGKGGSAGADGVSIEQFEVGLNDRLYVLWNRMSSGSYFPGPVRAVDIPKKGGARRLGIPNVVDRIAQTAAAMALEGNVEQVFHEDSYGYRPGRSPLEAVAVCRKRSWQKNWVLDVDIRSFFDSVPWDLMLRALARHTDQKWVLMYVERWLEAPMLMTDGSLVPRVKGTPQGSPISPILANLFLHYGFDKWMERECPAVRFERFADDVVIHCVNERQAMNLWTALASRLVEVGLELHPDKTRIVYCKDSNRRGNYEQISFVFCGYAFRPRLAANKKRGVAFTSFLPAVSQGKLSEMGGRVASWLLHRRVTWTLDGLAEEVNPVMRGWLAYYTAFYPSAVRHLCRRIDRHLMRWAKWKYKRLKNSNARARTWLRGVRARDPELFVHWRYCAQP